MSEQSGEQTQMDLTLEELELTIPPDGDVPEVDDDPEVETFEVPE